MSKAVVEVFEDSSELLYFCPACGGNHLITFNGKLNHCGATWNWNGDLYFPTITPSINAHPHDNKLRCHHWVTAGQVIVCNDLSVRYVHSRDAQLRRNGTGDC